MMRRRNIVLTVLAVLLGLTTFFPWILFSHVSSIPPKHGPLQTGMKQSNRKESMAANETVYHFLVSSGCSPYQRWQVLTQIHSARAIRQQGRYTWIVSGCPDETKDATKELTPTILRQDLKEHFVQTDDSLIAPDIHFTPDFSNMSVYDGPFADGKLRRTFLDRRGNLQYGNYGNNYHFNNKPNGLLHWAERRYANTGQQYMDEAIVLIDPDFLFMAPFSLTVPASPGKPAAAWYGLGGQWLDFNLTAICGSDSPCTRVTNAEIDKYYTAGPPYVLHAADVVRFARQWAAFVPPTYDQYPLLYAEMYAYSMAAVHLNLPHSLEKGLFHGCMVGWKRGGGPPGPSARAYLASINTTVEGGASTCYLPPLVPPSLLHYCQRYFISNSNGTFWFMAKRRVPNNVLDCDSDYLSPLFTEEEASKRIDNADWHALAVCSITRAVNYAKQEHCKSTVK